MKHLGTRELQTERLLLRRIREEDAEELFLGFVNQKEFLYYAHKEERTLEEEKASLVGISEKYENERYYNWLITLKESGKIIGQIILQVNEYNDSVEFSYAIDKRYTGRNYMTEALERVKAFSLEELEVNRFQGGCCVENTASRRVMEKCGLTCEGMLRKYLKLCDGYHDMYMLAVVRAKGRSQAVSVQPPLP